MRFNLSDEVSRRDKPCKSLALSPCVILQHQDLTYINEYEVCMH